MGCLSGHVHYATRILGFWMPTLEVERGVEVCYFVCRRRRFAACCRGGRRKEGILAAIVKMEADRIH